MANIEDLSRAAIGCRALAYRYTCAAQVQMDPRTRAGLEREAREMLALAEGLERTRQARQR
jgi:hypothetical protein